MDDARDFEVLSIVVDFDIFGAYNKHIAIGIDFDDSRTDFCQKFCASVGSSLSLKRVCRFLIKTENGVFFKHFFIHNGWCGKREIHLVAALRLGIGGAGASEILVDHDCYHIAYIVGFGIAEEIIVTCIDRSRCLILWFWHQFLLGFDLWWGGNYQLFLAAAAKKN